MDPTFLGAAGTVTGSRCLVRRGGHRLQPGSGRLQQEADCLNRHQASRHEPALPRDAAEDAHHALRRLQPLPFDDAVAVAPGLTASLKTAGHLPGGWMPDPCTADSHTRKASGHECPS